MQLINKIVALIQFYSLDNPNIHIFTNIIKYFIDHQKIFFRGKYGNVYFELYKNDSSEFLRELLNTGSVKDIFF